MTVIDYALIVLFFVLLAGLLLLVIRSKPGKTGERAPTEAVAATLSSRQTSKVAYGLVAVLFVLLLIGTWLSERGARA